MLVQGTDTMPHGAGWAIKNLSGGHLQGATSRLGALSPVKGMRMSSSWPAVSWPTAVQTVETLIADRDWGGILAVRHQRRVHVFVHGRRL